MKRHLRRARATAAVPPFVVFCTSSQSEEDVYTWFTHEADVLLYALGWATQCGEMSADDAFAAWLPYRHFWPAMYWRVEDRERLGIPLISDDLDSDYAPGFRAFLRDTEQLRVPGIGLTSPGGMFDAAQFEVEGDEALEALDVALHGRYRIVMQGVDQHLAMQESVAAARRAIVEARK